MRRTYVYYDGIIGELNNWGHSSKTPALESLSIPGFDRQEDEGDHGEPDTAGGEPKDASRLVRDILLGGEGGDDL